MPQLGESIAEATIIKVLLKEGERSKPTSNVIEVETNKAVMGVTSPCSGNLSEILVEEGKSYPVGAVLGYVEVDAEEAARLGLEEDTARKHLREKKPNARPCPPAQVKSNRPSKDCRCRRMRQEPLICRRA